jgi:diketogulonate reductase-like aldo/keto reductase
VVPWTWERAHPEENAAAVSIELSDEQLATLNQTVAPGVTGGARYRPEAMTTVEV